MSDGLLSTREAASRLRRSEQWVRNAARDGDLESLVEPLRGGRTRYRFTVESIEQYLAAHGPASGNGPVDEPVVAAGAPPLRLVESAAVATARTADEGAVLTMPTTPAHADDADLGDSSIWIDHYREEITRYRLRVAELERTVDEMFVTAGEKDDEIRRLCDVIRRLLPDEHR